jgi:hypothetical protein
MKKLKAWFVQAIVRVFGNIQIFWQPMFLILWGETHYNLKGPEMRQVMNKLEVGDILLRKHDRYISSWFIPGFYKHAAIFVGKNKIIHATTHDIFEEDILTFLRCDSVAILRIKNLTEEEKNKAIDLARDMIGKGYDFDFGKSKDGKYYCTSLVRWCYPNRFKSLKDEETIKPQDFFYQGLDVIHDSRIYREDHT